jgi:hypothetical protein
MQILPIQKRLLVVPVLIMASFAAAGFCLTASTQIAQAQPVPGDRPPPDDGPPPPRRWHREPPPPDDDGPPPPRRGGRPRIHLNIGI